MGKTRDLLKKIRDTKGTFHVKMGTIKDRNGMELTAEDIKKWQEYTEEQYKRNLKDTDNYDGVISHLEPDILESKVKWALGIITMNKASGDNGIPTELFQILKDDAVKVLPKPLTVWITANCGKFLKRWEYQATWPASWEMCMQVKKQQLEPDMEQWTGSKLGKEYVKAVYCYPAYLTYMQSTSCEMPGWRKHKLESRLLGEISITSDMQMTPPLWRWKSRVKKMA